MRGNNITRKIKSTSCGMSEKCVLLPITGNEGEENEMRIRIRPLREKQTMRIPNRQDKEGSENHDIKDASVSCEFIGKCRCLHKTNGRKENG